MSKEAMTLALEALQVSVSCTDMYYVPLGKSMIPEVEEAIKALEEVLAKQEQGEHKESVRLECVVCKTVYEDGVPPQVAKQEQGEPDDLTIAYMAGLNRGKDLAPQPAQKPWVGLTDEEFNELYDRYIPTACYALLIEMVEAKLKEKNT